jgi:SAM-dependent methyltransferase
MNKNRLRRLKRAQRFLMRLLFLPLIARDYVKYRSLSRNSSLKRFPLTMAHSFPYIFDKTQKTSFDRHYIYHTAWAARAVRQINPPQHIDISSSLYFSSIVSAFVPVKFYDYRPPLLSLSNYTSARADLSGLPFPSDSIDSISCMHTIEHVGLGRYGDRLDPDGDLKAVNELKRVVAVNGHLLFVVPIGRPLLRFNAMRIYSYEQIMTMFSDMSLREFSLIHEFEEDGGITVNATKAMADSEEYGCGCFWFVKRQN